MSRPENLIYPNPEADGKMIEFIESLPDYDDLLFPVLRKISYYEAVSDVSKRCPIKAQKYMKKAWQIIGIDPFEKNNNKKRYRPWNNDRLKEDDTTVQESVHPKGWGDSMTDY